MEPTLRCKLCILRSNQGGEYLSSDFVQYLEARGIQYQLTTAYTPRQYGFVERKNCILLNTTQCLLHESKLSKPYWLDIAHLCVFGSHCFAKIPDPLWVKLDNKTHECIFLAYSPFSKGYKVQQISNGAMITSHSELKPGKNMDHAFIMCKQMRMTFIPIRLQATVCTERLTDNGYLQHCTLCCHWAVKSLNEFRDSMCFQSRQSRR
uniref:Retroviral polymerase SH3-like domain-containing protein n=1 Tax=Physcomitrium patens TaxID=3218 RepID=A0A2K1KLP1_PHYPA|nr:hypothetical protein PHYPA_005587 [Physcomitrium patens]